MKLLRFASLVALGGLTSLSLGQAPQKLFSYTSPARPAGDILADLSGITGTNLKIGSLAGRDIVAVRLKDVSLEDLMSQMAKALAGEWRQESDGYRLVRSDLEEQRQKRVEAAELAKQLKVRVDAMNAEVDKKPELTDADARTQAEESRRFFSSIQNGNQDRRQAAAMRTMAMQSPGSRAIARMLRNVDLLQLASMGPNTRLVFSTQPTRMQSRFNGSVIPILTQFVAEQRTFAQAQAQPPNNVEVRAAGGVTMVSGMPVAEGTPTSAILVATRWGFGDSIQLQLQTFDANGNALASGFFSLELQEEPLSAAASQPVAKPLKVSDQALQLAKLVSQGSSRRMISFAFVVAADDGGSSQPISISSDDSEGDEKQAEADLRAQVLNPEKYEPLSFVGALIVELAEQRGKNLVAVLPDSLLGPASRFVQAKPTDVGLLAALSEWGLKSEQDEKWMLVTPLRPAAARDSRIDRKALGRLLRTVDKTGNASLDDLGAYALSQPDGAGYGSLDMIYLRLISPVVASRETSNMLANGRDMLRLFATLSPAQRRGLGAGQPLAIASLSAQQRAFVHSLVFNSPDGPSVRFDAPPSGGPGGRGQRGRESMFGNGRTERTFALPNGLPGDGRITLQLNSESAVVASTDSGMSRFFTAEDLGRQRAMRENPAFATRVGGQAPNFTKYRPAMQTTYRFTFVLASNISMARSLSDTTIPGGVVPGSYDALSADFKNQELAAYQRTKRMFERRGNEEIRVRDRARSVEGAPPP